MFGHFSRACQTVSVVFTPARFARSFFATTIPARRAGSPATAIGTFRHSG